MSAELETIGRRAAEVHYINASTVISLEEVLQDQESVYQSLRCTENDLTRASSNACSISDPEQSSRGRSMERSRESSSVPNDDVQLALDEALARALQDLEDTSLSETDDESSSLPSSALNRESNTTDATTTVVRQDNVDPDHMTYEELQSLGEVIGTESRGLSEELISYLPSSKYKTGFFSRKEKHEECVICCMPYKNRDRLISLPCKHQYHSNCVTRWLKLNKACPVCNEEVFG